MKAYIVDTETDPWNTREEIIDFHRSLPFSRGSSMEIRTGRTSARELTNPYSTPSGIPELESVTFRPVHERYRYDMVQRVRSDTTRTLVYLKYNNNILTVRRFVGIRDIVITKTWPKPLWSCDHTKKKKQIINKKYARRIFISFLFFCFVFCFFPA